MNFGLKFLNKYIKSKSVLYKHPNKYITKNLMTEIGSDPPLNPGISLFTKIINGDVKSEKLYKDDIWLNNIYDK